MNFTCKLIMNSLYGRFGMHPILTQQVFVTKDEFMEFTQRHTIKDFLDLDDMGLFVTYFDKKLERKTDNKISISIASAVTAYSRVFMSQFKNNPKYNLYYSDTDSIVIDKKLPDNYIGPEIGSMKLENTLAEGVFISPKVYGGLLESGIEFTKVKGYKNDVTYNELKSLLNKDTKLLNLSHEKWFKNIENGSITVKDQLYTLQVTENKRSLIWKDNKLVGTKPFIIDNEKVVKP